MSDWKNNPAIAAIIAGSVVLTTTLLVTFNYVLPVYQQKDKNTISELQNRNRGLQNIIGQYKETSENLTTENDALHKESESLKTFLMKLKLTSAFQLHSPLPVGYAKIFPGMNLASVTEIYEKSKILYTESDGYLEVHPDVAGISRILYLAGDDDRPGLITHIYVFASASAGGGEEGRQPSAAAKLPLRDFLEENLGPPGLCGKEGYFWHLNSDKYYIFFSGDEPDRYSLWISGEARPGIGKDCDSKVWQF